MTLALLPALPADDVTPDPAPPAREPPALRLVPLRTGWCLGLAPGRVVEAPRARPFEDPERRRRRRERTERRRAMLAAQRAAALEKYQPPIPWPVPMPPAALTAALVDWQVRLSWSPAAAADTYAVKRATQPGGPYEVIGDGVRLTRGTNPTVTPGATYFYVVTARNAAGESAPSREVVVRVPATAAELYEAPGDAAEKETPVARAQRLAQLELARLDLPGPAEPIDPAKLQRPTPRSISLFAKRRLGLHEIEMGKLLVDDEIPRPSYPACVEDTAPCYFARCRHHLMTDVNRFGSLKISFPGWDVDEVKATCSIRKAREGKQTVEAVADALNLTAEAVRMIEQDARRKVDRLIDPERLWRRRPRQATGGNEG